jgi:hypothetical protein
LHARSIGKKDDGAQAWQQLQFAVECGLPAKTGVHDFQARGSVMSHRFGIAATLLAFAFAGPAFARDMPAGRDGAIVVAQASTPALGEDTGKRKSRKREGAAKREPTVNQMAARERQRKCAAEWKEAKAAGKTEGLKWPKYWSKCNARLKGKTV